MTPFELANSPWIGFESDGSRVVVPRVAVDSWYPEEPTSTRLIRSPTLSNFDDGLVSNIDEADSLMPVLEQDSSTPPRPMSVVSSETPSPESMWGVDNSVSTKSADLRAAKFEEMAAVEAIRHASVVDSVLEMVKTYRERRDFVVERLNTMPGITCEAPGGAFYVFPRCAVLAAGAMEGDDEMSVGEIASELLDAGIVCLPG